MKSSKGSVLVESGETIGQIFEIVIDDWLFNNGELFKDIPVVSTLVGGFKAYHSLKAKAFEKKFIAFMYEFNREEMNTFKEAIKKKSEDELGEEIINAIDNVDKVIQAKMIARATKLYISEQEQEQEQEQDTKMVFDHSMHAIRNLDSYLLSGMESIYGSNYSMRVTSVDQALFNLGLVDQEETANYASKTNPLISFVASDRGKEFYQVIILGDIIR